MPSQNGGGGVYVTFAAALDSMDLTLTRVLEENDATLHCLSVSRESKSQSEYEAGRCKATCSLGFYVYPFFFKSQYITLLGLTQVFLIDY